MVRAGAAGIMMVVAERVVGVTRAVVAIPSVGDVYADRALLDEVPTLVLVELRRQIAHLGADVDAALARHMVRLNEQPTQRDEGESLLTPEQAAAKFNVPKRWLLEHADGIPGVRRLSRKIIRFNERALRRHLAGVKA